MHDPSGATIKWVAAMHGDAIVPHQKVARLPFVTVGEVFLQAMFPESIQQGIALCDIHPDDPGMKATTQKESGPSRIGMLSDDWMTRPWRFGQGCKHLVIWPQVSAAVMAGIVIECLSLDRATQVVR